jgi:hypothetical protein
VVAKWGGAIVGDGSLPGDGFEINTAPAAGDIFSEEMHEICEALKQDGGYITNQAGAHVHIDARDFTFYDIRRLIFLYEKIEKALFGIVAPHRAASTYCRPCGPTYARNLSRGLMPKANKAVILKNLYNIDKADKSFKTVRLSKAGPRYNGLNLHSWMFRGSVECRIAHGTVDETKLVNWGVLWARILDFAYKNTESAITQLREIGLPLLCKIAEDDEMIQWIENRWATFHRDRR